MEAKGSQGSGEGEAAFQGRGRGSPRAYLSHELADGEAVSASEHEGFGAGKEDEEPA